MIPTRLGQSCNQGKVVGFNRDTGAVLVFSDLMPNFLAGKQNKCKVIDWVQQILDSCSEGYHCPSVSDFFWLGVENQTMSRVSEPFLRLLNKQISFDLFDSYQTICYLVTRDTIEGNEISRFHVRVTKQSMDVVQTRMYDSRGRIHHNSLLSPVYYITGANCGD